MKRLEARGEKSYGQEQCPQGTSQGCVNHESLDLEWFPAGNIGDFSPLGSDLLIIGVQSTHTGALAQTSFRKNGDDWVMNAPARGQFSWPATKPVVHAA